MTTKKYSFLQPFNKQTLLGVDLDNHTIKLIGLSLDNHGLRLELCAKIILDKNSTDKEIAATIKQQLAKSKIPFKKAAVAIAETHVFFKKLNVTNLLSRREMEKFILFNIGREMKLQPKEINYSYAYESSNLINIVAIKRSHVIKPEKLLSAAGLTTKIVDVDNYAIRRATNHCDSLTKLPCSDTLDRATIERLSPEMLIAFGLALRIQDED